MSFRDENEDARDIRKPFLHTGSWYRMGSRQSSMMGSSQVIRDSSISVVACVLIVALGPIQFGFTVSNLPLLFKFFFAIFRTPQSSVSFFVIGKRKLQTLFHTFLFLAAKQKTWFQFFDLVFI